MTLHANAPTFQLNQAAAMLLGAGLLFCGYQMGKNEVPPPAPLPARVVPCAAVQACPHHVVPAPPQARVRPPVVRPAAGDFPAPRATALRRAPRVAPAATPAPLYEAPAPAAHFAAAQTQPAQPWGDEPYPKARRRHRAEAAPAFGPEGYPPGPGCDSPPPAPPQHAAAGYAPPPPREGGGWDTGGWNAGGPPSGRPGAAPGWNGGSPGGAPGGMRGPMGPPPGYPGGGAGGPGSFPSSEGGRPPGY